MVASLSAGMNYTDSVKNDLKSASTTTIHSLKCLRSILGLDQPQTGVKAPAKRPRNIQNKLPTQTSNTAPQRRTTAKQVTALKVAEDQSRSIVPLTGSTRGKFATEVFNLSLRCVSEEVKRRQALLGQCSAVKDRQSPRKSGPLQNCSPNRQKKPGKQTYTAAKEHDVGDTLQTVAECAYTALEILREPDIGDGMPSIRDTMLREQGALVLLDKTISLGICSLAETQSRTIYEQYWKRRKMSDDGFNSNAKKENLDLADLIVMSTNYTSKQDLEFATCFQSQLLRLAILQGPRSITERLVDVMQVQHPGGPTQIIVSGFQAGYVMAERTGQQLHTAAQAMLKLYSMSLQRTDAKPDLPFVLILLIAAVSIKIQSWQLLKHEPDMSREVWTPITRALRKLLEADAVVPPTNWRTIHILMAKLSNTLTESRCDEELPADLCSMLAETAERAGSFDHALHYLQLEQIRTTADVSVIRQWKLATLLATWQEANRNDKEAALQTALSAFQEQIKLFHDPTAQILLCGTRLRKAILNMVTDLDKQANVGTMGAHSISLQTSGIRILLAFVQPLASEVSSLCPNEEHPKSDQDFRKLELLLVPAAKTFETVLAIEKYIKGALVGLRSDFDAAVKQCVHVLDMILRQQWDQTKQLRPIIFMRSLAIRISNMYWTQYMLAASLDTPLIEREKILVNCITAVSMVPVDDMKQASLAIRYETLAKIQLDLGEPTAAKLSLRESIRHHLIAGAAADAVNSALSQTSDLVWQDPKSQRYLLGRVLRSHLRLAMKLNPTMNNDCWLFDDSSLPAMERCVMLELQLHSILDSNLTSEKQQDILTCIQLVLKLSCGSDLCNYRLRFLSSLFKIEANNSAFPVASALNEEMVSELCSQSEACPPSAHLASFGPSLRYMVYLRWRILGGSYGQQCMKTQIHSLCAIAVDTLDTAKLACTFDDIEDALSHFRWGSAYGSMVDDASIKISCLKATRHVLELQDLRESCDFAICMGQLAVLQNGVGEELNASNSFAIYEKLITQGRFSSSELAGLLLEQSEYFLIMSDFKNCERCLDQVRANISHDRDCGQNRSVIEFLSCRAAVLASELAFNQGSLDNACLYARHAVKLGAAIWHRMDVSASLTQQGKIEGKDTSRMASLCKEVSKSYISTKNNAPTPLQITGSPLWHHFDLCMRASRNMAQYCSHLGLYRDATYYYEQIRTKARIFGSFNKVEEATAALSLLYARGGHHEQATDLLNKSLQPHDTPYEISLHAHLDQIEAYLEMGDLITAGTSLDKLLPKVFVMRRESPVIHETEQQMKSKRTLKTRPKTIKAKSSAIDEPPKVTSDPVTFLAESCTYPGTSKHHRNLLWGRWLALCQMMVLQSPKSLSSECEKVLASCSTIEDLSVSMQHKIAMLLTNFHDALLKLTSDAMNSVLTETAVALPVRYQPHRKGGRVSWMQGIDRSPHVSRSKTGASKHTLQEQHSQSKTIIPGQQQLVELYRAVELLKTSQLPACSSTTVHLLHKIHAQIALLTSTMAVPFSLSTSELVLQFLLPKDIVRQREVMAIDAEIGTKDAAEIQKWNSNHRAPQKLTELSTQELTDQIRSIPETWSVLSLSLAENEQELLVSKITASTSPFLLRIPLSRSDEVDEDQHFTFHEAKAELVDIISQANSSAHDKRGQGEKVARNLWYAERQSLDERLAVLLSNIENIWLGGFRGLMSAPKFDNKIVLNFGQALVQTLDNHLPSRQKVRASTTTRVELHSHVIELFLGLDDSNEQELDDAVSDLLYFVVDILQFAGERNAYDEIDFDAMLVEVLDALRGSRHLLALSNLPTDHTVLIVDKEFQMFPWESLPCLRNRPVSRMPSLGAVFDRLSQIRQQAKLVDGYTIPVHTKNTYILNPSSDLISTQQTFEPILKEHLPSFQSLINKPPTETEFESLLHESDLLLYFGHGSGAQYIRGRTIRKMDRCAVTMLMGCSSAKMVECGQFESYGMPNYYSLGGSMAVVGTLWDVTDRDIDRFALETMVEWGLVPEDDGVREALRRSRNKKNGNKQLKGKDKDGKVVGVDAKRGKVALDEAVMRGRDGCLLRYLNGAAPVIYGLPVYLE